MSKIAVFPGSFDPITIGHLDIVLRALQIFDEIHIAIGENSQKNYYFALEKRIKMVQQVFEGQKNVYVNAYVGLTVDFCKTINATYIVRGLRSSSDFEYEKNIAQLNQSLANIETIFYVSQPQYSHINSTIVREILRNKGDISKFVPAQIINLI